MPSLWDMHGHVGISSFLNYAASGVSNVRDMEPTRLGDTEFIEEAAELAPILCPVDAHGTGAENRHGLGWKLSRERVDLGHARHQA